MAPDYLVNLLPSLNRDRTHYLLRNADNYTLHQARTVLHSQSFFPNTTSLWNQLPINIRNSPTIAIFKTLLRSLLFPPPPPEWFSYGIRNSNILLARMRNNCSILRSDLFKNHIVESPTCLLCELNLEEGANHFLFVCTKHNECRLEYFRLIKLLCTEFSIEQHLILNTDVLLSGTPDLNIDFNKRLVSLTFKYLIKTERFK